MKAFFSFVGTKAEQSGARGACFHLMKVQGQGWWLPRRKTYVKMLMTPNAERLAMAPFVIAVIGAMVKVEVDTNAELEDNESRAAAWGSRGEPAVSGSEVSPWNIKHVMKSSKANVFHRTCTICVGSRPSSLSGGLIRLTNVCSLRAVSTKVVHQAWDPRHTRPDTQSTRRRSADFFTSRSLRCKWVQCRAGVRIGVQRIKPLQVLLCRLGG